MVVVVGSQFKPHFRGQETLPIEDEQKVLLSVSQIGRSTQELVLVVEL